MFDVYKGATRPAMLFGVPTTALLWAFMAVGFLALSVSIVMWILLPVVAFVMRMITKRDDKAFHQIGLYIDTKMRCPKVVKNFFGATSYSHIQIKNKWSSWNKKTLNNKG